jgi:membrane-associated phospholipid phosphatase
MGESRPAWGVRLATRMWWLPLITVGILTDRGSRLRWFFTPGIVALSALASSVGKLAIRRPRPGSLRRRAPLGRVGAASFPSTHSTCAFAVAGWLRGSRQAPGLHLVAFLIGWSRVRSRAHRGTDVAAGAALGYGIVWQIDRSWSRFHRSRADGQAYPGEACRPNSRISSVTVAANAVGP